MKGYSSREIIKLLIQFKHPSKNGKITVPHPKKDLPRKTVKSIFKQAGINS